jgi:hypothetical protein
MASGSADLVKRKPFSRLFATPSEPFVDQQLTALKSHAKNGIEGDLS